MNKNNNKINKNIIKNDKWTTSKILTWFVLSFYFISLIMTVLVKIFKNIDITFMMDYLQPLAISIIFFYFGKSGVENWEKIKMSSNYNDTYSTSYNNYKDYDKNENGAINFNRNDNLENNNKN